MTARLDPGSERGEATRANPPEATDLRDHATRLAALVILLLGIILLVRSFIEG